MFPRGVRVRWALVVGIAVAAVAQAARAGEEKKADGEAESKYVRLVRDDGVPVALETAIVRFVPKDSDRKMPVVDLIAAVHLADKAYYEKLNELFEQYDAVLFELVAPEGTQIPKGGGDTGSGHPISVIQRLMTGVLALEYQLRGVDYTKKNFVHADLSPEKFNESMKRRGESMWTVVFRMMGYAMAQQGDQQGSSDAKLLMALLDPNRALALKRVMSEQFQDMDGALSAIQGESGSAIITDRNQAALEVLEEQIDAGKKKIAIFYGGGHMPDFEQRLRKDFGLVPVETRWLTAWDMKDRESGKNREPKAESREPENAEELDVEEVEL
jgi:hypothetical protein